MTPFSPRRDPDFGGIRKLRPGYVQDRKPFPKDSRPIDPFMISLVEIAGKRLATPTAEIYGRSRARAASLARQTVWAIAAFGTEPALSFSSIGRRYGRDHTTIINGVSRIAALAVRSRVLSEIIDSACRDAARAGWPVRPVSAFLVAYDARLSGR